MEYSSFNFSNLREFLISQSLQISLEDVLPKRICTECYAQLKKCISFKQQIESADATLKEAIKQHAVKYSEKITGNLDVASQTKEQ